MTGVSECSQQRGSLKDDGYMMKCASNLYLSVEDLGLYVWSKNRKIPDYFDRF
ncbi:hypothetical protein [Photorhabdus bodei]|uniref:Uncharacterized protein n=1 Tax=Photorhabdus bodei TaxID=2029681 RepID=A0ABX0AIJ9_9GAMM|nr:hypothetical protein [Photorhabdus bodei]NDK98572.1 hypothetical protein [Photorhabdus bodei]NDL02824.1 hypothetical protein [Photorhabdus bodei]NDL07029.1 hypothetical protein [Photorhabdus bodei]